MGQPLTRRVEPVNHQPFSALVQIDELQADFVGTNHAEQAGVSLAWKAPRVGATILCLPSVRAILWTSQPPSVHKFYTFYLHQPPCLSKLRLLTGLSQQIGVPRRSGGRGWRNRSWPQSLFESGWNSHLQLWWCQGPTEEDRLPFEDQNIKGI